MITDAGSLRQERQLGRQRRLTFTRDSGRTGTIRAVLLWVGLLGLTVIWLVPFAFMLFTSLKSAGELLTGSPYLPPLQPRWENYVDAWRDGNIGRYGLNSLLIAVIKVPCGLLVSALAAFAFARIRFRWSSPLFLLLLMGMMLPVQIGIIPLFDIILRAGWLNTYQGVILPYIAFGIPFQTFVLRGYFKSIPSELDEAATIDGVGPFGLFWQIILPLSLPVLTALFIIDFVSTWNEFPIALVLLSARDMRTIPLGLIAFQGENQTIFHLLNAAIVMSVVPVVIVYLLAQRHFVSGLAAGAIKG